METTFYEDSSGGSSARPTSMHQPTQQQQQQPQLSRRDDLSSRKRSMTLDLNSAGRPERSAKQARCSSLLTSPDLNMLQLASPELERLIIAHNGLVTTTPTPTTLFSRTATEEQENYARGFVDALAQLHQQQQQPQLQPQHQPAVQPIQLTGPDVSDSGASTSNDSFILPSSSEHSAAGDSTSGVKDEPQTVPRLGATPPLSPIDMRDQERIKLERKRLRNRIAASKCRKRKLERISRLEQKVHELKTENSQLGAEVSALRDQVCRLKQEVMLHVKQGCQMMVTTFPS
uniref:Putative transcriptional activator of the jun family n=1 Tax=Amblyomma aureolatum TaxID=187763 RepID=A0A1E1XAP2_9ACAR